MNLQLWLIVASAAAAALAFARTAGILVGRAETSIERRLAGYEPLDGTGGDAPGGLAAAPDTGVVKHGVALATRIAERAGQLTRTEHMLEQANLPIRAGELIFYTLTFASFGFLGFSILLGPLAGVIVGAGVLVSPVLALRQRRAQRVRRFEEMLPSTLTLMASSMRAGFSLAQALDTVAAETQDPIKREMQRVATEVQMGRPIEDSLREVAERMESRDLAWTVMAIKIQREVGGNLASLLDTVAETMTKRERLRREVKALTAEGRLSAIVLSIFPPAMAGVLFLVQPTYIEKLFSNAIGVVAIGFAAGMSVLGWVWLQRIVDIKE